ncbi:hypothetical protein LX97_02238 [Nonlabens dokdonensis]|jgi:uncharacterized membrane protein|uniref:Uncharacterized protein n=2 Tax=Nonlabens dokdonensis TaxID=328515 RepID=L7WF95_NONDD|nr:hypothetical protein [Nonlabens dokdonensis]AGC77568.1 hypothetical protein DDD_2441 [Nonlabens dokdonensis DSW-6]PZX39880.1 hypothetical protein LX97_02238 [Nonlabens dokdonensis]
MAVRKRNPILGGIMAAAFIGFGGYRLYERFVAGAAIETWKIILSVAFIVYGLFIVYTLFTQKDA